MSRRKRLPIAFGLSCLVGIPFLFLDELPFLMMAVVQTIVYIVVMES